MYIVGTRGTLSTKISHIERELHVDLSVRTNIFESLHDKTNKMTCAPSKLRSAWSSAQSDQSLRCPHEETLGAQ